MGVSVILACAGNGTRAKQNKNKLLVSINGETCLKKVYDAFKQSGLINQFIICASNNDKDEILKILSGENLILSTGGNSRTESIANALPLVNNEIVLIHDGARPFVSKEIIQDCIDDTKKFGSSICVYNSRDTICKCEDGRIVDYLGKDKLYSVQTPQGFITKDIISAYNNLNGKNFNDDGEVYLSYHKKNPHFTLGSSKNVKITYPEDLLLLSENSVRFGVGFDCHKLVENRKLIIGGIEIPHNKGLLGHSDADVLTHAIMDAILSSLALRDIGFHFPDNDPTYKNANSIELLKRVLEIIDNEGYKVQSISASIMAEKPKLLNYIPKITDNLASILNIHPTNVGITATTLEGLGFVGREEGICTHATAVLVKK